MADYFKPPKTPLESAKVTVFLAGSIEMGIEELLHQVRRHLT